MVILGFMLNYALRVNLTIAIVAMVEEPAHKAQIKPIVTPNLTYTHSTEELSSAAHTLPISTTPEPFQNITDKVSISTTNKKGKKKLKRIYKHKQEALIL